MERINYYAGRDIAGYYSSDMRREQKKKAKDIQIMYNASDVLSNL